MIQKSIRDYGGNQYTVLEGSELVKELNDRTDSAQVGYNSIDELATKFKEGVKPITGTFSEFKTLSNNNELKAGTLYKMTNFQTIYDQPDYSDAITPKATVVTKTAPVDPIILLAISSTKFAKEVYRPSTPNHTLEYDFDFTTTEINGTPAKGRISKCIDEFENSTDFDHTVVEFIRYERISGSGTFNSYWDTGFASEETLMFKGQAGLNTYGNNAFAFQSGGFYAPDFILGNNVFEAGCNNNSIGIIYTNNTIGYNFGSNTIGDNFGSNTIRDNFGSNTVGGGFGRNTVGTNSRNNTIGGGSRDNTIGDYFGGNTVGDNFGSNKVGGSFRGNTVENEFQNNTIEDSFQNNIVGNIFRDNIVDDFFQYNTLKSGINNLDFTTTPATHVYGAYDCEIFTRQDGEFRLRYVDNEDLMVVVYPRG